MVTYNLAVIEQPNHATEDARKDREKDQGKRSRGKDQRKRSKEKIKDTHEFFEPREKKIKEEIKNWRSRETEN